MKSPTLFFLCTLTFIVGCSSGGGGGADTVGAVEWSTLRVFSDGGGTARLVDADTGQQSLLIGPNITSVVAAGNDDIDPGIVTSSDFPVVDELTYATVRDGTVTVDGVTANVRVYEDRSGDSGVAVFEVPGIAQYSLATGTVMTGTPTGTFDYVGTHGAQDRITGAYEIGTFDMTIDFDSGTFNYSGQTTSSTLNGSGTVDISNARFASGDLVFEVPSVGYSNTATMHGLLHGKDAEAISAIYHTNENSPEFDGAAAGSKK